MKAVIGATLLGAACSSGLPDFDAFVQLHQRSYVQGSSEYRERAAIYERNKAAAEAQNNQSSALWKAGVNKLWDWSEAEFKTLRGWDGSARPGGSSGSSTRPVRQHVNFLQREVELPKEKIWADLQMAQRVKNQGGCGSCWAFATSNVLEAHMEIASGIARTFSVQQIVSCTPNPKHCGGDGGCKGATAELGMQWVLENGCASESEVPYSEQDGLCNVDPPTKQKQTNQFMQLDGSGGSSLGMTGWETLPKNEYMPLLRALAEEGPVAVSVSAQPWSIYEKGIFNGCDKDAVVDHAVTAIGYGEEKGTKYWLIQNSWGNDWGEKGHIRLERHQAGGYCGMNNKPQDGVACQGETDPVPVCGMCGVLFDSVIPHFRSDMHFHSTPQVLHH
eukprot:TRINITY_DN4372_c0_g2_i1.p1 TRINITY_DN4372_c0_g2~~TRINITY_DN4372_c0_g2_i1.p1  ORF type:complete len:389 (-),score=110.65 TRINITY_DN4372_c0_g2_i1:279-1445(-)